MKKTIPILFLACLLTATCLALPPVLSLVKSCSNPASCTTAAQAPGTDVTYSISFNNSGNALATNTIIFDPVPINTDYLLGSATSSPGTTGITFVIEYSADNGATWVYVPVSGAAARQQDMTGTSRSYAGERQIRYPSPRLTTTEAFHS